MRTLSRYFSSHPALLRLAATITRQDELPTRTLRVCHSPLSRIGTRIVGTPAPRGKESPRRTRPADYLHGSPIGRLCVRTRPACRNSGIAAISLERSATFREAALLPSIGITSLTVSSAGEVTRLASARVRATYHGTTTSISSRVAPQLNARCPA